MWNVDPSWPPPLEVRHRPQRAAYVFAVLMPLVLLIVVAAPFGIVWGLSSRRGADSGSGSPSAPSARGPDEGQPGVGDPYYPDYGSSGYDASKYAVSLAWDVETETLTATTTMTARATQTLASFYVDLALTTDRVMVNGKSADFRKAGFQDVRVTPAEPVVAGTDFSVVIDYSGDPTDVQRGNRSPWWVSGQEWTVAGEPESSPWWFPANDHPSDPALMDVSVQVPAGMEAISVGRLESVTSSRARLRKSAEETAVDTWHWVSRQPMATYLSFLSIGQYELRQGVEGVRPYVYAVSEQLSGPERQQAFAALLRSGAVVRKLETMFGPYPFSELGGIVAAPKLRFAGLETQTRPIYDREAILSANFSTGLIVHELAHMWFGNNVTLRQWNDIFNNEAYAAWAQWGYAERTGGRSANAELNALYDRAKDKPGFWRITMIDPTSEHLFDTVYQRGPMVLQALRNVIGDDAFFSLARDWSQDPGSRSLEEWMVKAQSKTKVDLVPFFQTWIYGSTAPERNPQNGFRR